MAKRRLVVPRRGFFVIVPLEYRQSAAPPPDWYIDALMKSCGRQYYVGLLSAAALHGAVRIAEAARLEGDLPIAQRLGHLLDAVSAGEVGTVLAEWVAEQHPRFVALRPDRPGVGAAKDGRWRVLVNDEVEVEE